MGYRAGRHRKYKILPVITQHQPSFKITGSVNPANLIEVPVTNLYNTPSNNATMEQIYSTDGGNPILSTSITREVQNGCNLTNLTPLPRSKPFSNLSVHTWNARSIGNKTDILLDYVIENDADIMFLNETWLADNDSVVIGELTPPGYDFINVPRGSSNHGGLGILFKKSLKLSVLPTGFQTATFEHVCISNNSKSIQFVAIYRPPPSVDNGLKTSEFLTEFEKFLDEVSVTPGQLVILGDFNIHIDCPDKWDTKQFLSILSVYGFRQHVTGATHKHGHTLDLVITRLDDDIIQDVHIHPPFFSDHHIIQCTARSEKPPPVKVSKTSREYGKLDKQRFSDILNERLCTIPADCNDPNTLCDMYESITVSVLDELCPVTTRERIVKPRLPWYNDKIHQERRIRRRLERKWRKSRSEDDYSAYVVQKESVRKYIVEAKQNYFTDKFIGANTKDMFKTLNGLLNQSSRSLPNANSDTELVNDFLSFFVDKVDKIRSNVVSDNSCTQNVDQVNDQNVCMSTFKPLTDTDVAKIIGKLSSKACSLDTLPSWLIKENLPCLLPIITRVVNESLLSGVFPDTLKDSIVTPVLKKVTLDPNAFRSYRPVANIKFIAKVIEKAASNQVIDYVSTHDLGETFQSAYKTHHSTETALLQVRSHILQSLDNNKGVLLVLLDLSAAFDTIDHSILINRLECRFGITGAALGWFGSYLQDRSMRVSINNVMSEEHILLYSVPQGSIIGPQGFIMYIHPIGDIIRKNNINFHIYADDTQLFCEFDPKIAGDLERALGELSSCILEISSWMSHNMLQLNKDKTEFIVFASPYILRTLPDVQLKLGDTFIPASTSVKNLGTVFDSTMSMSDQISAICRCVNFHIRNLWRIRRFITQEACHHAVRALVLSRLDYANSLLYGVKEKDLKRLQRLQNKAARLVYACGRDWSSAYLLRTLHWLPVKERIKYKVLLYVFKSQHCQAPSYLMDTLKLYNSRKDVEDLGRRLRSSSDVTRLVVPRSKRKAGDKSFNVIGPQLWNQLPVGIREAVSVPVFKGLLKTYLFPAN